MANKRLGTIKDVAARLDVSDRAIWKWNATGRLPKPIRLGRSVRWDLDELDAWIDAACPDRETWEAQRQAVRR